MLIKICSGATTVTTNKGCSLLKRVNNVTAVVKNSLIETNPIIPCPDGYGWTLNNDILEIVWMLNKPAPDEIIELISCSCRKNACKSNRCVCKSHSLHCTDLCSCDNSFCENFEKIPSSGNETSDEKDEDDEQLT